MDFAQHANICQVQLRPTLCAHRNHVQNYSGMGIGLVIRRKRQAKGWNLAELAHAVDTDAGNISRIERGKQACSQEMLEKIAKALGVKISQLFAEAEGGPGAAEKPDKSWLRNIEPGPELHGEVPLISWVQAGHWTEIMDIYQPGDGEEWIMVARRVGPHAFALRIHGDSMTDEFAEGDVVVVDPDREVENKSFVIVRLDDQKEATFKQIIKDGGKTYLKPLNPRYPIIELDGQKATICGVVVQKTKVY